MSAPNGDSLLTIKPNGGGVRRTGKTDVQRAKGKVAGRPKAHRERYDLDAARRA